MNEPTRLKIPQPIHALGTGTRESAKQILSRLEGGATFMMGADPALPTMPQAPASRRLKICLALSRVPVPRA